MSSVRRFERYRAEEPDRPPPGSAFHFRHGVGGQEGERPELTTFQAPAMSLRVGQVKVPQIELLKEGQQILGSSDVEVAIDALMDERLPRQRGVRPVRYALVK